MHYIYSYHKYILHVFNITSDIRGDWYHNANIVTAQFKGAENFQNVLLEDHDVHYSY